MEIKKLLDRDHRDMIKGYWAEEHYPKQDFAEKCNEKFNLSMTDESFVQPQRVIQGWIKKHEHPEFEFEYWIEPCSEDDKEAIASTYFFYDYDYDQIYRIRAIRSSD